MSDPAAVIVGAGAAGIGAGLELTARGIPFVILEAQNRVGGRAFTDRTSMPVAWDQGCHWLHCADKNPLVQWADRLGADYHTKDYPDWFGVFHDGRWASTDARDEAMHHVFGALDAVTWAARGWVNVLFVPAIAIAARRSPDWDLRIFVSRQVVFYTTTLVAVGVYFLLMSLGGFLLIQFGGSWGAMARAVFFVGAAVVLAALLSSSSLRGRFKIFLHKHFFQNRYDYREEWLRLVSTLADFDGDAGMGVAVRAIAEITDSPSGVLWVRDAQEKRFKREADWDCPDDMPDLEFS